MKEINHEYYVSPEVAKLLKEAGFDWDVYKVYELNQENKKLFGEIANWQGKAVREDVLPMPTLEVAQRWLREVKGYYVDVAFRNLSLDYRPRIHKMVKGASHMIYLGDIISSYEYAQEAGINKALEIILEKGE